MGTSVSDIQKAKSIILSPRTPRQKAYLDSLRSDRQTFVVGPAGTGKTFLAASVGAQQLLMGEKRRLIIVRPAVAVDEEEHGFLPGSLEDKLAPWAAPTMEVIREYLSRDRYRQMVHNGDIAFIPFTYIRGRTFDDSFVILDEAQNTTVAQMKAFLTRTGERTKIVVNGDESQSDLVGTRSGLDAALELVRNRRLPVDVNHFGIDDVARSEACRMWVEAFSSSPRSPHLKEVGT